MENIDKIINLVRKLKEEAIISSSGPTNSSNAQGLGFDPQKESPPIYRKKKYAYGGKNSRKWWLQFLKKK